MEEVNPQLRDAIDRYLSWEKVCYLAITTLFATFQNDRALEEAREFIEKGDMAELEKWFCGDKLVFGTAGNSFQ